MFTSRRCAPSRRQRWIRSWSTSLSFKLRRHRREGPLHFATTIGGRRALHATPRCLTAARQSHAFNGPSYRGFFFVRELADTAQSCDALLDRNSTIDEIKKRQVFVRVSGRTPSCFIASAAGFDCINFWNAAISGMSATRPTRLDPAGSTKVFRVMPIGPNTSSRLVEASQCFTSLTSWVAIIVVIVFPSLFSLRQSAFSSIGVQLINSLSTGVQSC